MSGNSGGWTLIARFSNADGKNWMRDDAYWWYDIQSSQGSPTSTSTNSDMISEAFWKVQGSEIKITRKVTIVQTLLFFVHIITALVEKHTEDSCPLMGSLVTVTFGPIISVLVAAQCTLVDCTRPLLALVKRTAVAIFKEATALDSGVSGMQAMVQL